MIREYDELTTEPTNIKMKVPIASNTPAADMVVIKNLESELDMTIETTSFTEDSPYLEIRKIRQVIHNRE